MLPLTLLKHCCTRCKNSNKFGFNSLAGVFGNRTPHGTNNCSTARGELSACRLRGGRCCVRLTIYDFYIGSFYSKVFVPFGAIPLNQLQSLCDRNPRGITFGYASRDHCFVIASEGVIKKRAEALFFITPTQL